MNMHAMNMQRTVVVGADWTLHPWRYNSSNVEGVTAGQARHNSSNVGGVTAARWDTTLVYSIMMHNKFHSVLVKHCTET